MVTITVSLLFADPSLTVSCETVNRLHKFESKSGPRGKYSIIKYATKSSECLHILKLWAEVDASLVVSANILLGASTKKVVQ